MKCKGDLREFLITGRKLPSGLDLSQSNFGWYPWLHWECGVSRTLSDPPSKSVNPRERRSTKPTTLPGSTFRTRPNRCQVTILVLCIILQKGQQDRWWNRLCQEGCRKVTNRRQELRSLAQIRLTIWISQHVPWIQIHSHRWRRHPSLQRYGCPTQSPTRIYPNPPCKYTYFSVLYIIDLMFINMFRSKPSLPRTAEEPTFNSSTTARSDSHSQERSCPERHKTLQDSPPYDQTPWTFEESVEHLFFCNKILLRDKLFLFILHASVTCSESYTGCFTGLV